MSELQAILGSEIQTKSGVKPTEEVVNGKKLVGLYFSAHWCPPCRAFTPSLCQFYNDLKQIDENALELIFFSSDNDEDEFSHYYETMPFTSIPYDNQDIIGATAKKFGIRGIPSLIILDGATGAVVDANGRTTVSNAVKDPSKALATWKISA
eukprot:gene17842-24922_t